MLERLTITNLALIQNIEIDLYGGFSVFTGETGAGKSILMGAIGLLLGHRAASEHIRSGEEQAEVLGSFSFNSFPDSVSGLLQENEIPVDDGTLLVRRVIRKSGRNRIIINGVEVPLQTLKKLGDYLIDLHGQHDHQTLLQEDAAVTVIDRFQSVQPFLRRYREAYSEYVRAESVLKKQRERVAELQQRQDFLQFQYDEISQVKIKPGEEEELKSEFSYLSSVTERGGAAVAIDNILQGGDGAALSSMLGDIQHHLVELSKYDDSFSQWQEEISASQTVFNELERTISSYLGDIRDQANPSRLDAINNRLAKIQRLKKKYQSDCEGLIKKQEQLAEELDAILNGASDIAEYEKALKRAYDALLVAGRELTDERSRVSETFDREIERRMCGLGFEGPGFKTLFTPFSTPHASGIDMLSFEVRTNRGEPYLDLRKTASGGEISRIMLAIKATLAEDDPVPILVFDEIDTGVGGKKATGIADTMRELSSHHQIFVISHLQQIASQATHHYVVEKQESGGRVVTTINRLSPDERVREIARMLGGESDLAIEHAKDLLKSV